MSYDRDRALAEALASNAGRGAGREEITDTNSYSSEGVPGGVTVARVVVPDWAARTWQIILSDVEFTGVKLGAPLRWTTPGGIERVPDVTYGSLPVFARIKWGVGAAQFEAFVDWGRGGAVQVHGSSVELIAMTVANPPFLVGGASLRAAGGRAFVSGAIVPAEGFGRAAAPPTLSTALVTIPAATTDHFGVPAFAKSVHVTRGPGPNNYPAIEVVFFRDGLAATPGNLFMLGQNASLDMNTSEKAERMIRVPANARIMSLRNTGAFPESFKLEWELNLG